RRIGYDVDRDRDVERARELERLEVLVHADALAKALQALLIDRFEADEYDAQSKLAPELEHLLVPEQHIPARFEIILLADTAPGDRLADLETVPSLHERHIVDDEHAGLAEPGQLVGDHLRRGGPVASPVKGPGATKSTVPRAATCELDRGA